MPIWGALFLETDRDPALKELRITNLANYVKGFRSRDISALPWKIPQYR
jgi:hypothetical protein